MNNPQSDIKNRINKLDSLFLWVASLSGVGFSVFIAYLELSWILYIPIFILIACSIGVGYIKGAVLSDSFTERIRGWNYLLLSLFTYLPLIFFNYSSPVLEEYFVGLTIYLQTFTVVAIIVVYVVYTRKKVIPRLYSNFEVTYGKVSKKIIARTMIPAFILGTLLYLFALILNSPLTLQNIVLPVGYTIFALTLFMPLSTEEKRIGKLLPLEKYQSYVDIEILEKNLIKNIFGGVFGVSEILFLIFLTLPLGDYKPLLLTVITVVFITSLLGFVVGQFYADRGDLVKENDTAKQELTSEQLIELRTLICKANGWTGK